MPASIVRGSGEDFLDEISRERSRQEERWIESKRFDAEMTPEVFAKNYKPLVVGVARVVAMGVEHEIIIKFNAGLAEFFEVGDEVEVRLFRRPFKT